MHLVGFTGGRCSSPGKQPSGSGVAELTQAGSRLVQAFAPIFLPKKKNMEIRGPFDLFWGTGGSESLFYGLF